MNDGSASVAGLLDSARSLTFLQRAGGRRHNYDDTPLVVGQYSVDQIKAFNAHHDRYYGWHPGFGNHYTNNARLPESFLGPASELWNR